MSYLSAALTLFLVMDPLGNVPLFASLLGKVDPHRRQVIIFREHMIALVLLLGALFIGPPVLAVLGIHGPALTLGGGVVLLLIAIRMIFPGPGGVFGDDGLTGEPLVVPLATPLIAGPSAMATLMMLRTQMPDQTGASLGALGIAWTASLLILLTGGWLTRRIGPRTTVALERLMGMLLVLISVEMLLKGISAYLEQV